MKVGAFILAGIMVLSSTTYAIPKSDKQLKRTQELVKVIQEKTGFEGRIGNLKPIKRIKVGKDFLISDIETRENIDANDPGVKSQWAITRTNVEALWSQVEQEHTVKVAVIDTGVDYTHLDLKNRVNVSAGYDFVNNDADPMDDNGHGTHVAGIIAAEMNNEEGIVGIAGDLDVEILPIKVLDAEGTGNLDDVAKGIIYAVDQSSDIINLSLGGIDDNIYISQAIEYALDHNVLVIAASGNDNVNCDLYQPAGLDGVYTIGASSLLNTKANFSNFGSSLEIMAPGVRVLSTVPGGGYEAWDGTSMAAPIVSGIAAILKADYPEVDVLTLKEALNTAANDLSIEGKDMLTGYGLIDASKAYDYLNTVDQASN